MVEKVTFKNDIRLIYDKIPHTETVSIGFWLDIGSITETKANNGFTHFIEHMLFKGAAGLSAFEIARRIDSVGGIMNAFTTREKTCFYANVVSKYADMVLDLLTTMYYDSDFKQVEIEREKQVVLQEIMMYEDSPEEYVHDSFIKSLWPKHAVGFPIIGNSSNIIGINRNKIRGFYNKHYATRNMIVAVAGKIQPRQLRKTIGNLPIRKCAANARSLDDIRLSEPVFSNNFIKKKLEQVHFIIGNPGIPRNDDRRYALYLMNLVFGGSMSSRLYQRIRETEGICYSIYTFSSLFKQKGVMGIYGATSPDYLNKVFKLIREEVDKLVKDGISDEELHLAKEQMKGNILLGKESIEARMNQIAGQEIYFEKQISLKELLHRIDTVSPSQIKDMIDMVYGSGKTSITTLGPAKHITTMKKIEKWF